MLCFFFRHNCNKSLWENIFSVISHSCTTPLVRAPPQLPLFPSFTTCAVDDFQHLRFGNSQSPVKFTGKPKTQINIYIYIAHHLPINEVNGITQYLLRQRKHHIRQSINRGFWPAADNDAILTALFQHEEDNFSKLAVGNRYQ